MLAQETLKDLIYYLRFGGGEVAIFDGTNSNVKRRYSIRETIKEELPTAQMFFLELICTDQDKITENVRLTKVNSPDYVGWNPAEAVKDFKERIHQYEKGYDSIDHKIDGEDIKYIKLINFKSAIAHNIYGYVEIEILGYLLNLNLSTKPIYFMRHGET